MSKLAIFVATFAMGAHIGSDRISAALAMIPSWLLILVGDYFVLRAHFVCDHKFGSAVSFVRARERLPVLTRWVWDCVKSFFRGISEEGG